MKSCMAFIALLSCAMVVGCASQNDKQPSTTSPATTIVTADTAGNREKHCSSDGDCACGVRKTTGDCFYGNKDYVDTTRQCPDFCTGIAGQFTIKCVSNSCKQVKSSENQGTTTTLPAAPPAITVTIKNFAFSPNELTIKAGTTVTWVNEDSAPHMVASDPHPAHTDLPGLVSGTLAQGQAYSYTFDKPGTFGYHCHIHPSMTGRIIVEA
jgi:plastocyanin